MTAAGGYSGRLRSDKMPRFPGKLNRTMPYAAGMAINVFRTIADTVTCRLSSRFSLKVPRNT